MLNHTIIISVEITTYFHSWSISKSF